jgi:2-keto-3-deoxy-L-rhamnonate aldolase RhmA
MKSNPVKATLNAGGVSIGTFLLEFNTTGIARLAASAGAEFAILDMEHTGWGTETIRMLIATSRSTELVPVVRVPAAEYHFIARALDMGAMGVMVPMVESVEQARLLVRSAKYPPEGRRGAAFVIAHDDYVGGDLNEKVASANREVLLIGQIETAQGVENVEAIAAVPGLDVIWIGQADLSNSLGIPGQYEHPKFLAAVDRVVTACRKNGKVLAWLALGVDDGRAMIARGFTMIAYGGDLWIYQQALRQGIAALRSTSG